jgi:hypothetical protein
MLCTGYGFSIDVQHKPYFALNILFSLNSDEVIGCSNRGQPHILTARWFGNMGIDRNGVISHSNPLDLDCKRLERWCRR